MEDEKELAKGMAERIAKTAQEKSIKKELRKKIEMTGQKCNKKGETGEFEKLIGDAYTSWECIPCIC